MKKKLSIIVFIAIIAMFIIPCLFMCNNNTAKAETLYETFSISKDKFVDKTGGYDNWSSSVGKTLYVGQYNLYGYTQSVLGFDIPSLPENVTSIRLYFCVNYAEQTTKLTVSGSETDDWTNNATVPNKDIELVNNKDISTGWNSVDVTSFVLDQYNGDKYATLVMSPTITSSHNGFSFFANEHSSVKPCLKVAYAIPSVNAVPNQDVKEANINGMNINLTIDGNAFNSSTLNKDMFTLGNDAIANGVTIDSITYIDDTHATLILASNQDIDEHFNILVTIDGSQLTAGCSVTSNSIYVESIYEIPVGGTYNLDDMGVDANIEISTTEHVILTQTSQDAKENFTISYLVNNADLEIDSIKIDNESSATDYCLGFMGDSNKLSLSGNSSLTAYRYTYHCSSINFSYYKGSPAILVDKNTVLEISGTGALVATADGDTAIGSDNEQQFGTINITGGNITALGGYSSPAIGGGYGGTINISSGTITATGGWSNPGIGNSQEGGCIINISGGTITATGSSGGAGIGTANAAGGCTVNISGGTITATGGSSSPGIGTATLADGGIVNISGGLIYATGNFYGSFGSSSEDIGNGYYSTGCQVSITGQSVVFLKKNKLSGNANVTVPFYDTETITDHMAYGFAVPDSWSGTAYAYISNNIEVNDVSLLPESANLYISNNETLTLTTNVIPSYASNTSVSYSSSDETVATVSSLGVVSCVSGGTAIITVTTTDGGYTDTCNVTVCKKVTGVSLSPDAQTLVLDDADTNNDAITLTATISPNDATDKTVTYNSSNSLVATVDSNGLVTAVKAGTATITVETTDGGYTDTCDITVEQGITGFSITPETSTLILGDASTANDSISLSTVVLPSDATDKSVSWVSSDTAIATVDSSGLVTAIKPGTTTITGTTNDGGFTDTCEITVEQRVTGVSLDITGATLILDDADTTNDTVQLKETVLPSDATNKVVTWASSDESVATVSTTGLVTAVSAGSATITVTTDDGGYTDTCDITVEQGITGFSITPETSTLILGDASTANDSISLSTVVLPSDATDKSVSWVSSDTAIATVDSSGLVTAIKPGTTTITGTTNDGGFTDTCEITVEQRTAGIDIDLASKTLLLGDSIKSTVQLTAIVSPDNASNKDVIWTSSDETIATVDSTGFVTGISVGSATIKAEAVDGGYTDTCDITVEQGITGFSITPETSTLILGDASTANDSISLSTVVLPSDATDKSVSWVSSDTAIATVDSSGLVTAIKPGTTTITGTTNDGGYTDVCKVTVVDMTEYAVNKYGGLTGNLMQNDGITGIENWNVTLYSTPVSVTTNVNGDFSYSNVQYSHHTLVFTDDVGVEFDRYTLNFSAGTHNGYSVSGDTITLNYTTNTTNIDLEFIMNSAGTDAVLSDVTFTEQKAHNPQTGEKNNRMWIWFIFIIAVVSFMVTAAVISRKKMMTRVVEK